MNLDCTKCRWHQHTDEKITVCPNCGGEVVELKNAEPKKAKPKKTK